jgi:predicted nucleic acid-binding protein
MIKKPNYYWDSSAFLAVFQKEKDRVDVCKQILSEAAQGKIQIFTSSITLVEVIKITPAKKLKPKVEAKLDEFFKMPYITLIDATRRICDEARHLIWKYPHLAPKDSIHLASALYGKRKRLDEIHSYDTDFLKLNTKIGTPPYVIREPYMAQIEIPYENDEEEETAEEKSETKK